MRKKMAVSFVLSLVVIISAMILFPSFLFAAPVQWSENGHYYELISGSGNEVSWQNANTAVQCMSYNGNQGYLATITSAEENTFIASNLGLNFWSSYWIGGYQQWIPGNSIADSWQWITGENWSYSNWRAGEPNDMGDAIEDREEDFLEFNTNGGVSNWCDMWSANRYYIVEYGEFFNESPSETGSTMTVEPVWIRDTEMKCKQIWINGDNNFQFSFIYPYANNNWVKIYDMNGKEVYNIDMPYDNPNIIVDLPDGMYTVKTFNDQPVPIQTFVIGKP
jgi:hypothetical protein